MRVFFLRHPSEADMALFAGGEAGPFSRWRIENHLTYCYSCREVVADFFHLQSDIGQLSEIPQLNWSAMGRDIKVAMQQATTSSDEVATSVDHGWQSWIGRRPVWGLSVAGVVIFGGFIVFQQLQKGTGSDTFVPLEASERDFITPVETSEEKMAMVQNRSAALEVKGKSKFRQEREREVSLFPAGLHYEDAEVGVAADGSMSIRTFDFSTDTVTITHVYIP